MYQFAANSIHYLLAFWQRMVSSVPYVKGSEPHQLEQFGPLVTKAYIESRMHMASNVVRDGLEDPLEDHSSLHQQMEQFSVICRCKYEKTCQQIRDTFDQIAAQFQLASNTNDRMEISVDEGKLRSSANQTRI